MEDNNEAQKISDGGWFAKIDTWVYYRNALVHRKTKDGNNLGTNVVSDI